MIKDCAYQECIKNAVARGKIILERIAPFFQLAVRLWMANIFWKSGLVKVSNWAGTVDLFANDYHVPLLPPVIAAGLSLVFEIGCSVLLALGLATRLAVLPLMAITLVIQSIYPGPQNIDWLLLLGTLLFFGAGKLSLDYLIGHKCDSMCGHKSK